ncbi:unnamed protein product [Paramecium sonneborni]|uniref:Uncharacterized protein n=1 Tax=Paramecium sonneborni TaxID=65129 RepID=A0A8S1RG83_9CILI|nr:unnamed protein product [Paramecium sonneborni]
MFQPKMIELEKQLNCSQNHNEAIHMVVFDKKLKRQERLLCNICMETFESDSKTIGFKKVIEMIEYNQKNKVENIQRLIKIDVELVEQLLNEFHIIKQKLNQELDQLIFNSLEWIKSLNDIGTINSQYSFFDELEVLINNPQQNIFNSQQLIESITKLNNSLFNKINQKLSTLKNIQLYSQSELILQNLDLSHHYKIIDNSIRQSVSCFAISFNQSGSLMISASNHNIKVWEFMQGRLKEITTLNGHTETISCLQFSKKSNSFVSGGYDNSIRCWKQINEKEWQSSQSYQQHTNFINCLIFNQSENQLVSGAVDYSIKIWQIDFINNQLTYLYSLNKHTNSIYSLCFNQLENTLVSCGGDNQIIIWKQDNNQKWQFEYVVTQNIQESGCRLQFINDDQLIWVTGIQVSKDCISIFELRNGKYQENLDKQLQLIKNDNVSDLNLFPIFYNKEKKLMIVKHKQHVYLIKITNEGYLKIITQIKYESNSIQGALSNDGRYLVRVWGWVGVGFGVGWEVPLLCTQQGRARVDFGGQTTSF